MNRRHGRNPSSRSSARPCGKSGRLHARPDRLSSWEGLEGAAGDAEFLIELIRVNSYVSRAWRTSAPPLSHRFHELVEQGPGVVWPPCRLRVVLDRGHGQFPAAEPLDGLVVE